MSEPVQLSPHILQRLATSKVLLVLPMKPQPVDGVVDFWVYDDGVQGRDSTGYTRGPIIYAPYLVGDVITVGRQDILPESCLPHIVPFKENMTHTVTVTDIEAKRVENIDVHSWVCSGRSLRAERKQGQSFCRAAWAAVSDHPFVKSYTWLVWVEKN